MPTENCTVMDEMVYAELCTPTLQTMCSQEKLMIKRVVEKEQCQDITKTVCMDDMMEVPNTVCTYTYKSEQMMATAQNVEISFERMCRDEKVTVCEPKYSGYGHQGYGPHCKEVSQPICYNSPMAMPMKEEVTISYPVAVMECQEMPLMLPTVSCQEVMDKKCFMVPQAMDDELMVEKCSVEISAPSCRKVELTLPKQVCKGMAYGHLHYTA